MNENKEPSGVEMGPPEARALSASERSSRFSDGGISTGSWSEPIGTVILIVIWATSEVLQRREGGRRTVSARVRGSTTWNYWMIHPSLPSCWSWPWPARWTATSRSDTRSGARSSASRDDVEPTGSRTRRSSRRLAVAKSSSARRCSASAPPVGCRTWAVAKSSDAARPSVRRTGRWSGCPGDRP